MNHPILEYIWYYLLYFNGVHCIVIPFLDVFISIYIYMLKFIKIYFRNAMFIPWSPVPWVQVPWQLRGLQGAFTFSQAASPVRVPADGVMDGMKHWDPWVRPHLQKAKGKVTGSYWYSTPMVAVAGLCLEKRTSVPKLVGDHELEFVVFFFGVSFLRMEPPSAGVRCSVFVVGYGRGSNRGGTILGASSWWGSGSRRRCFGRRLLATRNGSVRNASYQKMMTMWEYFRTTGRQLTTFWPTVTGPAEERCKADKWPQGWLARATGWPKGWPAKGTRFV